MEARSGSGGAMNRSLVVPYCLIVFLISPAVSFAQPQNFSSASSASNLPPATVSVHELQIPEKARAACKKGTDRLATKDSAGSIPEFQKAIKAFPGYYEAYARLGTAEMNLQRWDDAEAAFRESIELSGGHYAPANFGLGLILATVRMQFPEAEKVVRVGLEMKPGDETGNYVLAWVLYSTSRLEEAEKVTREAISNDPSFAGARLLLAQIHIQENNPSAVVEDLDAYLALGITGPMDEKVRAVRDDALRAMANPNVNSEVAKASY
jgi:tetratricopeptide (TPR) repeat protein